MNYFKAILSGVLVWMCVVTSFMSLDQIPILKDSFIQQAVVVGLAIVVFATLGAGIYYRNGNKDHGLKLGIIMSITALVLDALVTVPFFEIPNGGNYQSFFFSPMLWILVAINTITPYVYWRRRASVGKG